MKTLACVLAVTTSNSLSSAAPWDNELFLKDRVPGLHEAPLGSHFTTKV